MFKQVIMLSFFIFRLIYGCEFKKYYFISLRDDIIKVCGEVDTLPVISVTSAYSEFLQRMNNIYIYKDEKSISIYRKFYNFLGYLF